MTPGTVFDRTVERIGDLLDIDHIDHIDHIDLRTAARRRLGATTQEIP